MITDRQTPRQTVKIWLEQLTADARAERAGLTMDKILQMSPAMLSMVASSHTANPTLMRELVDSGDYPERAHRYISRNWILVTGISSERSAAALARQGQQAGRAARNAISLLVFAASELHEPTAENIVEMTEEVGRALAAHHRGENIPPDAVAILIREAIGMPGDGKPASEVTNPVVLSNAMRAMTALGARLPVLMLEDRRPGPEDMVAQTSRDHELHSV